MSSPFRLEGRYLEAAIEEAGTQTVSNVIQYAEMGERLRVLGADGVTWEDFDMRSRSLLPDSGAPEDHWTQFALKIAPGSSHGSSRTQREVRAFTMFKAGALSMEGLYEQTDFPANAKLEMERLQKEHEMGLGAGGKVPRPNRAQRTGKAL